jgi:hypothetical protein
LREFGDPEEKLTNGHGPGKGRGRDRDDDDDEDNDSEAPPVKKKAKNGIVVSSYLQLTLKMQVY